MTEEGEKQEPCKSMALVERKISQKRLRKLLYVSMILTKTSQMIAGDIIVGDLLEAYQEASECIDRLIVAEVKYQEKTM